MVFRAVYFIGFFLAGSALAEVQVSVSLSAPSPVPGGSGAFSVGQTSGAPASASGTATDTYSGLREYAITGTPTGRYSTLSGAKRYGLVFDTFQLVENFLSVRQLSVMSSSTTCPSATDYTWIKVRGRPPDATRLPMDASSSQTRWGGVFRYDASDTYDFTGESYFDLAGPTLTTTSYNLDRFSAGCTTGSLLLQGNQAQNLDSYGRVFFGAENAVYISESGNPVAAILAPQVTLASGDFSALADEVFSGQYAHFQDVSTQNRKRIFFYPDALGTTFTLRESNSLSDPFSYTTLGTLTCTSLNSPTDGFCSGTLTLDSVGGSGKAVCQLSTPGTRKVIACASQYPADNSEFVSLIGVTSHRSLLSLTPDTVGQAATANPGSPPAITVAVRNVTGRSVPSMGDPSAPGDRLTAPFSYVGGTYPGTDGTCGSDLPGYSSCTIKVEYDPSSLGLSAQTMRVQYDNAVTTVYGTSDVKGTAGLTSITITPDPASFYESTSRPFTATGTFSDLSTVDITNYVTWSSTNSAVATVSSTGASTFETQGSTNIAATFGSITSNTVSAGVRPDAIAADTSTSADATGPYPKRRTFFDSQNDRHWVFFYNGSAIEYAYSADDGATWNTVSTLAYATTNFDIAFKAISGTGYVFLVADDNTHDVILRRGTLSSTNVTFESAVTVFDGTSAFLRYEAPSVTVSTDDYVWVVAARDQGTQVQASKAGFVRRSTNVATGALSSWETAEQATTGSINSDLGIYPGPSGSIYVSLSGGVGSTLYRRTSAGAWTTMGGGALGYLGFPQTQSANYNAIAIEGSNIYIGGSFTDFAADIECDGICKWNGSSWSALGPGLQGTVNDIFISGSDLYAVGTFLNAGGNSNADYIALWNGSTWSALGSGVNDEIKTVFVQSSNVYIGGSFTSAGGNASCARVCNYTSGAWTAMGSGVDATVEAISGDGTNVFVGGSFVNAGGNASADRIARWNGTTYLALGTGIGNNNVLTLLYSGSNLYVGGDFINAGGVGLADRVGRWDGSAWNAMGNAQLNLGTVAVDSFALVGSNLYASCSSCLLLNYMAYSTGSGWLDVGPGPNGLNAVAKDMAVSGTDIYLVGDFNLAGGVVAMHLAAYDTVANTFRGFQSLQPFDQPVLAAALHPTESDYYLAGAFNGGGESLTAYYVIAGDGREVGQLGTWTLNAAVNAMAHDGTNLFVAGEFTNADLNLNADYILSYNGTTVSSLGTTPLNASVEATVSSGGTLYVGGSFTNAGGNAAADRIATWNGSAFGAIGTGPSAGTVKAIHVSGANVFIGGDFTNAGGNTSADFIARYNGGTGSSMGTTFSTSLPGSEEILAISSIGSNVFIGGNFQNLNSDGSMDYIARWDGSNWYPLGTGLNGEVRTLATDGTNLFVGGAFTDAGGNATLDYVAKWDGANWSQYIATPNGPVNTIVSSSTHPFIKSVVGGEFTMLTNYWATYVAFVARVVEATGDGFNFVVDSSADIHVTTVDSNGDAVYYQYDSSGETWSSATVLSSTDSAEACVSLDSSTGDLHAFWLETGSVWYRKYTASGPSWDTAASLLEDSASNANLSCDDTYTSSGGAMLVWTQGAGSPYSVNTIQPVP